MQLYKKKIILTHIGKSQCSFFSHILLWIVEVKLIITPLRRRQKIWPHQKILVVQFNWKKPPYFIGQDRYVSMIWLTLLLWSQTLFFPYHLPRSSYPSSSPSQPSPMAGNHPPSFFPNQWQLQSHILIGTTQREQSPFTGKLVHSFDEHCEGCRARTKESGHRPYYMLSITWKLLLWL